MENTFGHPSSGSFSLNECKFSWYLIRLTCYGFLFFGLYSPGWMDQIPANN